MNCFSCEDCPFEVEQKHKDLFFELHLTVSSKDIELNQFKLDCETLQIKPIMLDLYLEDASTIKDLMTSSRCKGSSLDALTEAQRIFSALKFKGYDVKRVKIETVPWHPDAPTVENNNTMGTGQYLESHLAVRCKRSDFDRLVKITESLGMHLSKNAFKKLDDLGNVIYMATLRWYDGFVENFQLLLAKNKKALEDEGFIVNKEIIEFTWFDSEIDYDNIWLGRNLKNDLTFSEAQTGK